MDNFEDFLGDSANKLQQIRKQVGREKTIIVHPQVGRDVDEAKRMADDWSYREEKQVEENLARILGVKR
jgi:hypothetical protein